MRTLLPSRRTSRTYKTKIRRNNFYVTVGYYGDGRPGEVFIDGFKTGQAMRTLFHAFAQVLSVSLQCGVPLDELAKSLQNLSEPMEQGFDPSLLIAFTFECISKELDSEN